MSGLTRFAKRHQVTFNGLTSAYNQGAIGHDTFVANVGNTLHALIFQSYRAAVTQKEFDDTVACLIEYLPTSTGIYKLG